MLTEVRYGRCMVILYKRCNFIWVYAGGGDKFLYTNRALAHQRNVSIIWWNNFLNFKYDCTDFHQIFRKYLSGLFEKFCSVSQIWSLPLMSIHVTIWLYSYHKYFSEQLFHCLQLKEKRILWNFYFENLAYFILNCKTGNTRMIARRRACAKLAMPHGVGTQIFYFATWCIENYFYTLISNFNHCHPIILPTNRKAFIWFKYCMINNNTCITITKFC